MQTLPPTAPTPPDPSGGARRWRDAEGEHIDVRGLAAPAPLIEILRLVAGADGAAVIVHHDRDPQLLYPRLAELGWVADRIAGDAGEVRLRLTPEE